MVWRNRIVASVFVASTFSAIGCTQESSYRQRHDGPKTEQTDQQGTSTDRGSKSKVLDSESDKGTLLSIWQRRLKPESLDREIREGGKADRDSFAKLSEDVLTAIKKSPHLPTDQTDEVRNSYLNAFERAILLGCDEDLSGCRYLGIFQLNPSTITLILETTKNRDMDLRQKFRMLKLAYSFLNQREDSDLTYTYLAAAADYEKLLERAVESGKNPKDRARLESHREVVDQILLDVASRSKNQTLTNGLVDVLADKFQIWNFDRTRIETNATRDRVLLQLTARRLFEGDELQKRLTVLAATPGSISPKLEAIRLKRPKVSESLGLELNVPKSLTTFLLESLWLKKLTVEEARFFWEKSLEGKSDSERQRLAETMKQEVLSYVRNRLFLTAQEANKVILDFFNTPGRFTTSDAFQEAIKESVRGQFIWTDARERFDLINLFQEQNFRSYSKSDSVTKEITFFFAGLDRNIKLISTYPSMLVMCYHLARLKFSLQIMTWSGVFKIDAGNILDWLFNGHLWPWFPYGNDKNRITKSEMLLVYHYAAELGMISEAGIDVTLLFKMMNDQMLGALRENVQSMSRAFRMQYESGNKVVEFKQICDEQKKRNARGSKVFASSRMPLNELEKYALMGFPQEGGGNIFLDQRFFEAWTFWQTEPLVTSHRLDDNLEVIRLELTPKIQMFEMYRNLTQSHLDRHGDPSNGSKLAAVNGQIEQLREMRRDIYSRVFRIHNSLSECSENFLRGEVEAQAHVIRGLTVHFANVHRAMAQLRRSERNGLDPRFGFHGKFDVDGLDLHERGLGYNQENYRFSRIQGLLLVADLLQNGYRDGEKIVGPVRDKNSILIPDRIQNFNQSLREKEIHIQWRESETEFVEHGLELYFSHREPILSWPDLGARQIAFQVRTDGLVALAKAGPQETTDGLQQLTIREVFKSHLTMLKALEPDAAMSQILKITARSRIPYLDQSMDDYAWAKGSRQWLGLIDYVYQKISADKIGDLAETDRYQGRAVRRTGPKDEFIAHQKAIRSLGTLAFRIPSDTMSMLNKLFSKTVDEQIELLTTAMHESARLEKVRAEKSDSFPSWRIFVNRPIPSVSVLSHSAVDRADGELNEFARTYGYKVPLTYKAALKNQMDSLNK